MYSRASDYLCSRVQGRRSDEPILVSGLSYMGSPPPNIASHYPPLWRLLLRVGIKVVDEWQISLGYVRGSNIYVRGHLDLRA